jgi:hypothetical protein
MASNSYIVRLSPGGDWSFGAGLNNYAQNNAAVAQDITYTLNELLGNCFFATNRGIDWWGLMGGKSLLAISLAVNTALLGVTGVTGILQTNISLNAQRQCSITYSVQTQYGTLQSVFVYSQGIDPGTGI